MSDENAIQTNQGGGDLALPNYGEMANEGWENATSADVIIPYLSLLQALSPQLDSGNAAYIEGAAQGDILNTATDELYKAEGDAEGVVFIPCLTEHLYTEWKPDRGGFVARHEVSSPVVAKCLETQDFGKYTTEAGNDLQESFYLYGIQVKPDGSFAPVIIAFSSTKIKTYKKAMSALRTLKDVPLFANQVRIKSIPDKNDKGQPYKSFQIVPLNGSPKESLLPPDSVLLQAAKAFKDEVLAGGVKVDYTKEQSGGTKKVDSTAAAEESAF